ncbi:hypothetical protein K449DRAFT_467116 [Hypoxylon sp. EC38]|nr:hypothetical protein K449DRAFT_467116 [Hypoxylon sp. EC38]
MALLPFPIAIRDMANSEASPLRNGLDKGENGTATTSLVIGSTADSEGILQWADWSDWLSVIGFAINAPWSIYRALVLYRNFRGWENLTMSGASQLLMGLVSISITVLIWVKTPLLYRWFRRRATRDVTSA